MVFARHPKYMGIISVSNLIVKTARRIVREDGVSGLFRGAAPTVVRAMSLNMGMLASNDQV